MIYNYKKILVLFIGFVAFFIFSMSSMASGELVKTSQPLKQYFIVEGANASGKTTLVNELKKNTVT